MNKTKTILKPLFYRRKPRRSLSLLQKNLLKFNLKNFLFDKKKIKKKKKFLEIGFGYGENIINLAKKNPKKVIIGCEVYEPGITNLLKNIEKENLKNILIFIKNIFILLNKLEQNSIEKIFILYPDPWPKKKHYKRRLITKVFVNKISQILKKKGIIHIFTDSEDYLKKILAEFLSKKKFLWMDKKIEKCNKRPNELIKSKYEKKADIKGNKKYYLKFKKIC